jgi:hypothetical protein
MTSDDRDAVLAELEAAKAKLAAAEAELRVALVAEGMSEVEISAYMAGLTVFEYEALRSAKTACLAAEARYDAALARRAAAIMSGGLGESVPSEVTTACKVTGGEYRRSLREWSEVEERIARRRAEHGVGVEAKSDD